jgi:hypothetical protein
VIPVVNVAYGSEADFGPWNWDVRYAPEADGPAVHSPSSSITRHPFLYGGALVRHDDDGAAFQARRHQLHLLLHRWWLAEADDVACTRRHSRAADNLGHEVMGRGPLFA